MRNRLLMGALTVVGVGLSLTGCTNPSGLDSISISPNSQALAVGQTAQLSAIGTYGNASHASTQPLTSGVTWTSNATTVAQVSTTGLVTAIGAGTATITASAQGFRGPVSSTATITVGSTSGSGGGTGGSVVSIAVIPSAQTVATAGQTTQFIAIGTTSTGATEYLTNTVAWNSSNIQVATIGATTGLATAVGAGSTTITALYTDATSGSVVTGVGTLTVSAGATEQVTSLSILPSSVPLTSSGQQSQLVLLGVAGSTGLTENLTSSPKVTWSSATPTVATVSATGLVTAVTAGTSTIVAQFTNNDGSVVTANGSVSVTISGTGTSLESITSLTIVPSSITVLDFQLTGQFLAIGTFSQAPYVRDVTNLSTTTWLSSEPEIFTVTSNCQGSSKNPPVTCAGSGASGGLVTAWGSGGAAIIAESSSLDGTIQTATATFSCPYQLPDPPTPGSCYPGQAPAETLLATLTVYNEGLNTTNWEVTAPSATGTQNVLHCGPGWTGGGGSVCTATYPLGVVTPSGNPGVVIEAQGGAFGGWSYNCTPSDASGLPLPGPTYWTAGGPNYCVVSFEGTGLEATPTGYTTVTVDGINETVGAIFN